MKKIKVTLAAGALAMGAWITGTASAPPAMADGCTNVPFASWCDGPPVNVAGDHYHCEQSAFHSTCGWRNAANQPIPYPGR
jgi:hypothetical protein